MDHFRYRDGELFAEDVAVDTIAREVGTPVYIYSTATLERHYRVFAGALRDLDPTVCYAIKANGNIAVIATLARLGAGADVVSGGELRTALAAGVPADRIVFSGVGKTAEEMGEALTAGVLQINVESEAELAMLDGVARAIGVRAPTALRVNPDVDAHTHAKISTGRREDKFGIEWTAAHGIYARAAALPGLDLAGVAVHIGSQLTDVAPFEEAFRRLRDLVAMLRADGLAIRTLDLGGGLGIPYGNEDAPVPAPLEYAQAVARTVGDLGCRLIFEPGRLIVGNAGILVSRVLRIKEGSTRTFVVIDAGMNDLLRPALYGAWHDIVPVREPDPDPGLATVRGLGVDGDLGAGFDGECDGAWDAASDARSRDVDIVGPICETSDTFATGRHLPPVGEGDLVAIRSAGAYGRAMASGYNARPLPPEVLVDGADWMVVRDRVSVDDMLARQHLPPWLSEATRPDSEAGGEDEDGRRTAAARP